MDYLKIAISSLASILLLFISAKIIGNKQMSQLNMFDYINGITIGSIAADMAIHLDNNVFYPVIAIAVYTAVIAIIGIVSAKSVAARRILSGKSLMLMDKGKLFYGNFKTAKIDLNEFLTQCRINGFFNPDDIQTAVLEQNGMISFMPKADTRPANPKDLGIKPLTERPYLCIVSDGRVLYTNLKASGISYEKLQKELQNNDIKQKDVFAAMTDGTKISFFTKGEEAPKNDFSE